MQLLRQGLGQARQVGDRDWDAMRLEWLGLDAIAPAVHDELERRFLQCVAKRRPQDPRDLLPVARGGRDRDREGERGRDGGRGGDRGRGRDGDGSRDSRGGAPRR
jgi:hypothetical protein